jgi:hypothetical protein
MTFTSRKKHLLLIVALVLLSLLPAAEGWSTAHSGSGVAAAVPRYTRRVNSARGRGGRAPVLLAADKGDDDEKKMVRSLLLV